MEKNEKIRLSVTLTGLYVDSLDDLVKKGIFLSHQDIFRDSLRRTFRFYGIESFIDKERVRKIEKMPESAPSVDVTLNNEEVVEEEKAEEEKKPEDVASS